MDKGWTSSRQTARGYETKLKGCEIFGLLRVADMFVERYVRIKFVKKLPRGKVLLESIL